MIDSITYNDLNLDEIYKKINTTKTSAGEDYLKGCLLNPFTNTREDFIYVINNANKLIVKNYLDDIGKLKKYSFKECFDKLISGESKSNLIHYISGILVIITFSLIFVWPGPGLLSLFAAVAFSLVLYFREQREKSLELYSYQYIVRMLSLSGKISSDDEEKNVIGNLLSEVKSIRSDLKSLINGAFLIKTNISTNGNPFDVVLDYARMIFHVDLIKYNNVLRTVKDNESKIRRLYEIIGLMDSGIAVSEYKKSLKFYCEPEFVDDNVLEIIDAYHPLLENPVLNSIDTDRNILLTGSNASGKSTFLKTVAVCILFAESFGFSLCKSIRLKKCSIYTSMALRDDITKGESYFIKEIKSLKRIIQAKEDGEVIVCFIDEVLRGTNTVERIAASTEILKNLTDSNIIVFAATHDIELTDLLSEYYTNYHFSEEVKGENIVFSYKINPGRSESSNAIKLLALMGYDENTVSKARERADSFLDTGKWN